jgi:hypothetical protein
VQHAFCKTCSCAMLVVEDGSGFRCVLCRDPVDVQTDPELCPKSPSGRHNAFHDVNGWCCSQCLAPMDAPADAGTMYLGRRTR